MTDIISVLHLLMNDSFNIVHMYCLSCRCNVLYNWKYC